MQDPPDVSALAGVVQDRRDADRAARARAHAAAAGVEARVHVMIGDASRFLHKVTGPFDVIFQDGDKPGYLTYLDRLWALLRPGAGLDARDPKTAWDLYLMLHLAALLGWDLRSHGHTGRHPSPLLEDTA